MFLFLSNFQTKILYAILSEGFDGKIKKRDELQDPSTDGRSLKRMLKKQGVREKWQTAVNMVGQFVTCNMRDYWDNWRSGVA
jgi:hypothetical protein